MKYSKNKPKPQTLPENKKCAGCGIVLTSNKNSSGYTPVIEKAKLCQRCFQIKHYGKSTIDETLVANHVKDVLDNFDFSKVATFYVVSPYELPFNVERINKIKSESKVFYLIISKIETLVNNLDSIQLLSNKIYRFVQQCGIDLAESNIIPCSYFKRINFNKLKDAIFKQAALKNKIAFCGTTNTGKSSIINWVIKREKVDANELIASYHKNTTQDIKQIKTPDFTLLDLPGFIDTNSFQSIMDANQLRRFFIEFPKWKSKIYQLKNDCIFIAENLFISEVITAKQEQTQSANLICYFSDSLRMRTGNLKNKSHMKLDNVFNKNEGSKKPKIKNCKFTFNSRYNLIVLNGLGIIVAKNVAEISFTLPESVADPFVIHDFKL